MTTNIRTRIAALARVLPSWLPFGWVRHIRHDGAPYLDRYSLREQGPSGHNPWRVYLHKFHAPDAPGHHSHPSSWSFSIVLWGSYTEEIFETPEQIERRWCCWGHDHPYRHVGRAYHRRVRWLNWIVADRYHRIAELHPGPGARGVWTLFVCGPLARRPDGTRAGWGFWVPGKGHVPVRDSDGK
jgi:hypothetical protein